MSLSDLKVLCRRLASAAPDDLVSLCPTLVNHVVRCGPILSSCTDAQSKSSASETSSLVHKFMSRIKALLISKHQPERFAAVVLIKAVVDVGGWECLRLSDPWVRGLISLLQKPGPLATKELCIATLVKTYSLLQGLQSLVRETVTPTLPGFVTACLQLVKPPATSKRSKAPLSFIETVACALSTLLPLYPTTLRPFASQMRSVFRPYLCPTFPDSLYAPHSLSQSCRRLVIGLHHTSPKNGHAEHWQESINGCIRDCHATANQVFRAAMESWESASGYNKLSLSGEEDPSGGDDQGPDQLPRWKGVSSGAERLIGLLDTLAEHILNPSRSPVAIPLGDMLDLTARLSLTTPAFFASLAGQTNPAISREEKDELCSLLPDIHVASMRMHLALIRRLHATAVLPLAAEMLDQTIRVFKASKPLAHLRETAYALITELLPNVGPSLTKTTVEPLMLLAQHCCRDILVAAGFSDAQPPSQPDTTPGGSANNAKKQQPRPKRVSASTNPDAFLTGATASPSCCSSPGLALSLVSTASRLLPALLSHLPQHHLASDTRALLDRTAILSGNQDAMLASVLNPFQDSNGHHYPSIFPFLAQQFPRGPSIEVLRTNMRSREGARTMQDEDPEPFYSMLATRSSRALAVDDVDKVAERNAAAEHGNEKVDMEPRQAGGTGQQDGGVDITGGPGAKEGAATAVTKAYTSCILPSLKRKASTTPIAPGEPSPKRLIADQASAVSSTAWDRADAEDKDNGGDDSDSDGTVQIDMTLEDNDGQGDGEDEK